MQIIPCIGGIGFSPSRNCQFLKHGFLKINFINNNNVKNSNSNTKNWSAPLQVAHKKDVTDIFRKTWYYSKPMGMCISHWHTWFFFLKVKKKGKTPLGVARF
jgi:hypothetical protein